MALNLAIVTPDEEALTLSCEEVVAPGIAGDLGLMPGHIPLVSILRPGVLSVRESGRTRSFAVGSGYVEIDDDKVIVLTESCDAPTDIDPAAEQAKIDDLEKQLSGLGPADDSFLRLSRGLELARSRLETARRG